jgi:energy-coupling factor transporter transmembrane protein EcfT
VRARTPVPAGCSPSALLLASLLALLGATRLHSLRGALVVLLVEVALLPLVADSAGNALRRAVPATVAGLSLGASAWWIAGRPADVAAAAGLRVLVLVLPGTLLAVWVDPSRLGDELAQRWRLPARTVVASIAALQQLEQLGEQWTTLERTRHVRGLGPGPAPWSQVRSAAAVTFGLLVATLRRSAQLALAMDARGFADAGRRTWAQPPTWGGRDTVLVGAGVLLGGLAVALG